MADGLQATSPATVDVTPENLRRVLEDIGRGAGWYTSAELYAWYASMCAEDGLAPVSVKAFGLGLKAMNYRPSTRRFDGKRARCWFISNRALREVKP